MSKKPSKEEEFKEFKETVKPIDIPRKIEGIEIEQELVHSACFDTIPETEKFKETNIFLGEEFQKGSPTDRDETPIIVPKDVKLEEVKLDLREVNTEKRKNGRRDSVFSGTSISDIRNEIDLEKEGTRFLVIGCDFECRVHRSIEGMIKQIKQAHTAHKKQSELGERSEQPPIWIDIQKPSEYDMKVIERVFHLHPLTTEDCIHNDTGEKWEVFPKYMYVVFSQYDDEGEPTYLNIILMKNYILSIHSHPIEGLDMILKRIEAEFEFDVDVQPPTEKTLKKCASTEWQIDDLKTQHQLPESNIPQYKYDVKRSMTKKFPSMTQFPQYEDEERKKFRFRLPLSPPPDTVPQTNTMPPPKDVPSKKKLQLPSADWILYAFLDAMVDLTIPIVEGLEDEAERLDEFVFEIQMSEQEEFLKRIAHTKRLINIYRRMLSPKRVMTTYLVSRDLYFISKPVQTYLRDVLDHIQNNIEKLDSAKEMLTAVHSNFMSKVSMEISQATSRTDAFVNRLSMMAALLGPIAAVSGVFGMNVKVPFQHDEDGTLYPFFTIVVIFVVFVCLFVIIFRKHFGIKF